MDYYSYAEPEPTWVEMLVCILAVLVALFITALAGIVRKITGVKEYWR